MLRSIYIKNFALIDDVSVELSKGLNILTGETGAGKSMLIDALQVVLGGRAATDFIRNGADKALIQAAFELKDLPGGQEKLVEMGLDSEDELLVLARQFSRSGKNWCRVNGQPASLSMYRRVTQGLVDMHGQHEQQTLMSQEKQREMLDRLGGPALQEIKGQVQGIFQDWQSVRGELEQLQLAARERVQRMDMLSFQLQEIQAAGLQPDEETALLAERKILLNSEKIAELAGTSYALLYSNETGTPTVVDLLGQAEANLRELARYDDLVRPGLEVLQNALYQIEDLARELADRRDQAEYHPERLDTVEERLSLIKKLKYKYGESIGEILAYAEKSTDELAGLTTSEERIQALEKRTAELEKQWSTSAAALTDIRKQAADQMEKAVAMELSHLEMGKVTFRVAVSPIRVVSAQGADQIEFLIAPNPGEPLKPLAKIASGGELSRVMLALKALLSGVDEVPTLIFDEVDTGVGGRALQAVGEKMAQIALTRQVLCVTHAAQVACFADAHYLISKEINGERTVTDVKLLNQEERVLELARMMAGKEITDTAKDHARQMLKKG